MVHAIFVALNNKNYNCFKILLEFGTMDSDINYPIIFTCAYRGDAKFLKCALKNGLDPNYYLSESMEYLKTPIEHAIYKNLPECVKYLLKYEVYIKEITFLYALNNSSDEIVELLVDYKPDFYKEKINTTKNDHSNEKRILDTLRKIMNKKKDILKKYIIPDLANFVLEY